MKKLRNWMCILFTLFTFASSSLVAHGAQYDEQSEDRTLAPYFVIKDADEAVDRFPLKDTTVKTNINGIIAETYVTQTYTNEGQNPINASYVFPASSNVTVHGLTITVGSQTVTARIKEKEEAREEFEEAKSEGKSASLMEQQRPNVFTMDVANIMPGATAVIELHYTELIQPVDGIYEFVFPTVVGPRYINTQKTELTASQLEYRVKTYIAENGENTDEWAASPYLPEGELPEGTYNITVNLSTGVPITDLSCKSHKVNVISGGESAACVTLADSEDYAGNRDFILKYKLTGEELQSGLMLTEGEDENFFMLTVQPPQRYEPEDIPSREYIFVLDISGSMYGYPLDTAKSLIRNLVGNLVYRQDKTDTFNLILFSDEFYQLSPTSLPATAENIQSAVSLIDSLDGTGGTEMLPALTQALSIPMNQDTARSVVIITDGYICDEKEIFQLINENMENTNFFSFGIGTSVNSYLINGIATAGLGESFIVTDEEDAQVSSERFRTYISAPLLTDIRIEYDGFDVYDVEPAAPSTLFAQKPIVLFGKWKGNAEGAIKITGKTGSQDYVQEIPVTDAQICTDNSPLSLLWARSRLQRITDYGCSSDNPDIKEEVTRLGLTYNMMTPYTSFVAVIDTVVNPDGNADDVQQANPLPLGVSDLAVGGGYSAYSEPQDYILFAMTGLLLLYVLRRRKSGTGSVNPTV